MDALTPQRPPSPLLIDALAFNVNCEVRRKHSLDGRTWTFCDAATEAEQGWSNRLFQAERSSFNIGGRAVQAVEILRHGLKWTKRYPIPTKLRGRKGKLSDNPAARSMRYVWWKSELKCSFGVWLHIVVPVGVAQAPKLPAESDLRGVDTSDRRSLHGRAVRFRPSWSARITDLRCLGLPVATAPSRIGTLTASTWDYTGITRASQRIVIINSSFK